VKLAAPPTETLDAAPIRVPFGVATDVEEPEPVPEEVGVDPVEAVGPVEPPPTGFSPGPVAKLVLFELARPIAAGDEDPAGPNRSSSAKLAQKHPATDVTLDGSAVRFL
jgi:hypothetical protein